MNERRSAPAEPWGRADVVRLILISGAGGLICLLAWNATATRTQLDDQTAWISFGVFGLFLAVFGEALWVRHGRHQVSRYRDEVLGRLATVTAAPAQAAPSATAEGLVAAPDMQHYHRLDCPIAAPRDWVPEPRSAHESAGRTPCGICRP